MLADCAKLYDRIILDSPPDVGGDRSGRARQPADGVVLVVKAGETTREAAMHARRQLASAKARLFGVVVNAIDFSNPAYGYEYYYRNYYRYGYTYGNGPDQKPRRRPSEELTPPVDMARALVTGVTGQLGYYVAEQLAKRGDEVWGLVRQSTLGRGRDVEQRSPTGRSPAICSTSIRCCRSSRRCAPTASSTSARRASSRRRGRSRS